MRRYSYCRQIILEEVKKDRGHPSAQEVFHRVRQRLPKVSLATVYRNLEALAAAGLIRKLETGTQERRFDGELQAHYHLHCLNCGRLDDVPLPPQTELNQLVAAQSNYQVLGHHLEFFGLCPDCRQPRSQLEQKPEEDGSVGLGTL